MSDREDSAAALIELMKRRAPGFLDLITAETDAEFEKALDAILEKAVTDLESNRKRFEALGEEGLSSALAMRLRMPGLAVHIEGYSNGHVDLIIEAEYCFPQRRALAEAKIYDGPEKHIKGLEQLLTRYTTGREGRGLLVVYFQKENIEGLVKKVRERMDAELPLKQVGATADHHVKWWFLSSHGHTSGKDMQIAHIGCNLYIGVASVPAAEAV